MEDPAASRSPVWGLVKSKNLKPRDEKRDRIPNPMNPMQYTKSNVPWVAGGRQAAARVRRD